MSRTNHLKELQNELHPLFDQGTSEQEAYDQLRKDPHFDTISLAKVAAIYNEFRNNQEKKSRETVEHQLTEEKKDPPQLALRLRSEKFAFFQYTVECDHKKNECLRWLHSQSPGGHFFIYSDLIPGFGNTGNAYLIDSFSNMKSQLKLPLDQADSYDYCVFRSLTHDMGVFIECNDNNDCFTFSKIFVSLLELDWSNKESRKLHTVAIDGQKNRFSFVRVLIDEMDPAKFVLQLSHDDSSVTLRHGTVVNDEMIVFKNEVPDERDHFFFEHCTFAANKFYTLNGFSLVNLNTISASIIDLDHGNQNFSINFEQLPEQFSVIKRSSTFCFALDRVFWAVKFNETNNYGIIWSKLEAEQWIETDFRTKEPIHGIKLVSSGSLLLVQTVSNETQLIHDVHQIQTALYRISLIKPEKLSTLAWFTLVHSKSQLLDIDPYEEARKYLPYSSEIQFPFE